MFSSRFHSLSRLIRFLQPVCNEDGNVVGLLDITKVFHEALDKVERGSSASEKLYSALAGVQSELGAGLGANPQTAAMLSYVEALREKTALPDLTTVMDSRTQPAVVGPRATVREVARLMRERRTTAVCVMEPTATPGSHPKIAGIFTSKDVVLRVIAAGLDASMCSVIRVMTPHPDTAPPTMTIHDALKKMHSTCYQYFPAFTLVLLICGHVEGHYLNLPVVEEDGRLVAIVDVLKLTYATLEQVRSNLRFNESPYESILLSDEPSDRRGSR
jgi:CBS domain-containing protein